VAVLRRRPPLHLPTAAAACRGQPPGRAPAGAHAGGPRECRPRRRCRGATTRFRRRRRRRRRAVDRAGAGGRRGCRAAAAASPRTSRDGNAGGDVTAATYTLLAVTGAAVALRVVFARCEHPEAEAARAAAECERLAREEASRAIRTQRLDMEILDEEEEEEGAAAGGTSGLGGEELLSALRKRVAGMDEAGGSKDGDEGGEDEESEEEAAARRGEEAERPQLQQQLQTGVDREVRRGREQAQQGRPLASAGVGGGGANARSSACDFSSLSPDERLVHARRKRPPAVWNAGGLPVSSAAVGRHRRRARRRGRGWARAAASRGGSIPLAWGRWLRPFVRLGLGWDAATAWRERNGNGDSENP